MEPVSIKEFGDRLNLSVFTNLQKGITGKEFAEQYLNGKYEIFTEKQVGEFYKAINDSLQKGVTDVDGLKFANTELASLQQVKLANGDNGEYINVYVREKQISTDNSLEKGGVGSGKYDHKKIASHFVDKDKRTRNLSQHQIDQHVGHEDMTDDDYNKVRLHLWKQTGSKKSDIKRKDIKKEHIDEVFGKDDESTEKDFADGSKKIKAANDEQVGADKKGSIKEAYRNSSYSKNAYGRLHKGEEDTLEKGLVTDSFNSYNSNKLSFTKTGKEIKAQITTVLLPALNAQKTALSAQLLVVAGTCGEVEPDQDLSSYHYRGFAAVLPKMKVYSYKLCEQPWENGNRPEPTEEMKCYNQYNDLVQQIVSTAADIEYCGMLSRNLKDEGKFELTPDQVLGLQF